MAPPYYNSLQQPENFCKDFFDGADGYSEQAAAAKRMKFAAGGPCFEPIQPEYPTAEATPFDSQYYEVARVVAPQLEVPRDSTVGQMMPREWGTKPGPGEKPTKVVVVTWDQKLPSGEPIHSEYPKAEATRIDSQHFEVPRVVTPQLGVPRDSTMSQMMPRARGTRPGPEKKPKKVIVVRWDQEPPLCGPIQSGYPKAEATPIDSQHFELPRVVAPQLGVPQDSTVGQMMPQPWGQNQGRKRNRRMLSSSHGIKSFRCENETGSGSNKTSGYISKDVMRMSPIRPLNGGTQSQQSFISTQIESGTGSGISAYAQEARNEVGRRFYKSPTKHE